MKDIINLIGMVFMFWLIMNFDKFQELFDKILENVMKSI